MSEAKPKASRKGIGISEDAKRQRKESRDYLAALGVNASAKTVPYQDLSATANDDFFCVFCRVPCVIWRGKNPLFICKKCEWGGNKAKKCDFALLTHDSMRPIRITQVSGTDVESDADRVQRPAMGGPSDYDEEDARGAQPVKKRKRPVVKGGSGESDTVQSDEAEGHAVLASPPHPGGNTEEGFPVDPAFMHLYNAFTQQDEDGSAAGDQRGKSGKKPAAAAAAAHGSESHPTVDAQQRQQQLLYTSQHLARQLQQQSQGPGGGSGSVPISAGPQHQQYNNVNDTTQQTQPPPSERDAADMLLSVAQSLLP